MVIAGVCDCGFRHSDTILLTQKEPVRFTLQVTSIEDLDARVIRSSSGTIRIPELGVDIEPGFASESYISNVEGVLDRIEGVVGFATRSAREAGKPGEHQKGRRDPGEDQPCPKRPVSSDPHSRGSSGKQRH